MNCVYKHEITVKDYNKLREAVGWKIKVELTAAKGKEEVYERFGFKLARMIH